MELLENSRGDFICILPPTLSPLPFLPSACLSPSLCPFKYPPQKRHFGPVSLPLWPVPSGLMLWFWQAFKALKTQSSLCHCVSEAPAHGPMSQRWQPLYIITVVYFSGRQWCSSWGRIRTGKLPDHNYSRQKGEQQHSPPLWGEEGVGKKREE